MHVELIEKPRVSFVVLTYNQERWVRDAVQSALAQTYKPLEVIVSDDCSVDGTFTVVEALVKKYSGPHRVIARRNGANMGLAGNLNEAWMACTGQLIVAGAGDDTFLAHRVERLVDRWLERRRKDDLLCSHFEEIDEHGALTGFVKKEVVFVPDRTARVDAWKCGATGACAAYSRVLFEKYGLVDSKVLSEDWVLSFRAWVGGGITVVEEPLVRHRRHGDSISFKSRNLRSIGGKQARRAWREKSALGSLGIAEEWLKAWRLGKWREDVETEAALRWLVQVRRAQARAFRCSRGEVIGLALGIAARGRFREALGMLGRHLLRIY